MNIKKASELTDMTPDTIRYYERIGLVPPIRRDKNGIRNFDDEDIRWLQFTRQMRNAGLSIEALIEYLTLFKMGEATHEARVELLKEQREELEGKLQLIQEAIERLEFKIDNYGRHMVPTESFLRKFPDQAKAKD